MKRIFMRPLRLALFLVVLSAIPILVSAVRLYQIPAGTLPADSAKFLAVPWAHFAHAMSGVLFGLLGPAQFAGVLAQRFGRLHRAMGRIFVAAGAALALSSLRLLWQFPDASTWVLTLARLVAGVGLGLALTTALIAIRRRDIPRHKAWMIRAYALGMGSATVSFLLFPIYLISGQPVDGLLSDLVFVASWAINIGLAEWVIRRPRAGQGAAAMA